MPDNNFNKLINNISNYHPNPDTIVLEKAYLFSRGAHENQMRASGEDYFSHCLAVANLLTELRLDIPTIIAALLHDVLEDTVVSPSQLNKEFGDEITSMVEGVTKIGSYHFPDREIAQAENWRKMLLAITRDIRVILIKLADRIHNMRTIKYLPEEKQKTISMESLNLYAPFAQRLGIYRWKSELEDLSFNILEPDTYNILNIEFMKMELSNTERLEDWKSILIGLLELSKIPSRLSARPKSIYGTFKKMERQKKPLSEIQDLIGIRIVTDTVASCYNIFGTIQNNFTVVSGSFTDYISFPKINMYQSLHVTVEGKKGSVAEIQIRTEEMHRWAEYGIAAHWRYKEKGESKECALTVNPENIEEKLDWLKHVIEWQQELIDSREFMTTFKAECNFEQIFVFTPKGNVVKLPIGSTAIDFAYSIHSETGTHCFGAKVGKKLVKLDYVLNSGEVCEILTRKASHPNEDWLKHCITARAKTKIRKYLRENIVGFEPKSSFKKKI